MSWEEKGVSLNKKLSVVYLSNASFTFIDGCRAFCQPLHCVMKWGGERFDASAILHILLKKGISRSRDETWHQKRMKAQNLSKNNGSL